MTKTIEEQQKKVDRIDTFVSRHYDYGCNVFQGCHRCQMYEKN